MNSKNDQKDLSPNETIGLTVVQNADGTESYESHTPDGYDEHLIPAETAARKEREGENFKHLPKYSTGSEHVETSGGVRVDKEGLMDNFALEPEMYYETRGDVPSPASELRDAKKDPAELRQEALRQEALRQETLRQAAIQEETLRQNKLHVALIREEKVHQDEIYQENLRLEAVRRENVRKENIRKETAYQDNIHQEELCQEKLNQDSIDQAEMRSEELNQDAIRQEEVRQGELRQEMIDQETSYQEELRQQKLQEDSVRQEEMRQEKLNQDSIYQAEMRQKMMERETCHQEEMLQEELRQNEIHQDVIAEEYTQPTGDRQGEIRQNTMDQEISRQEEIVQEELLQNEIHQDVIAEENTQPTGYRQGGLLQQMMGKDTYHQEETVQEELRQDEIHQDNTQYNGDRQNDRHEHEPHSEKSYVKPNLQSGIFNADQSPQNILKERKMNATKLGAGTFTNYQEMFTALAALKEERFMMDQVSVVGHDLHEELDMSGANTSDRLADAGNLHTDENKAGGTAVDGAIAGGTVGGFAGLLVGLGLLTLPGVGPVLLAGGATATAIATALSGGAIGAAAGTLAGGLVGLGIPADQAEVYAEHVDRGDYLVLVEGAQSEIEMARSVLKDNHIHEWHVYDLPNEAVGNVPATALS